MFFPGFPSHKPDSWKDCHVSLMDGYGSPVLVPSQDFLGGVYVHETCRKSLLLLSKRGQEDRLKIWLLVRKTKKLSMKEKRTFGRWLK